MPDDIQTITPSKTDSLSIKIYAAFLGGHEPRIQKPHEVGRPRMNVRVRLETVIDTPSLSPFHKPTWREQLDRVAGIAVAAIDEACHRLKSSRPVTPTLQRPQPDAPAPKPVVLIGPAAKRKLNASESRAA